MLFPLLLFLQMTGISSSLCGVSPKAPPCGCQMWCHRKGTVTEMISLLSLLLCSPFLPLTLYCAGRAPLHQPSAPLLPSSSLRGGTPHWFLWGVLLPSMGTHGKYHSCWALLSLNTPGLNQTPLGHGIFNPFSKNS